MRPAYHNLQLRVEVRWCQIGFKRQHSIRASILPKPTASLLCSPDRPETCLCPPSTKAALHSPRPHQEQPPASSHDSTPAIRRLSGGPGCFHSTRAAASINNQTKLASIRCCQAIKRPPTLQIASAPGLCLRKKSLNTRNGSSLTPIAASRPAASCILTWPTCSISRAPLFAAFSPDAAPLPPPNRAQVPVGYPNQTTHFTTPQWLLLRPSPSRCASQQSSRGKIVVQSRS